MTCDQIHLGRASTELLIAKKRYHPISATLTRETFQDLLGQQADLVRTQHMGQG